MNVLICDDEPLAVIRLTRLVEDLGHCVIATASHGQEVLELAKLYKPDVILLDIQMPQMDGLQCARQLTTLMTKPAVVFCTADNSHALAAFQIQANGYLLKPIAKSALKQQLDSLEQFHQAQMSHLKKQENERLNKQQRQHITVKSHRGMEMIPVDDIHYFLADQKYVTVRHMRGKILIDETLKELEQEFIDLFIRIHRNALVSLRYLAGLESSTGQQYVKIKETGERLIVSRRHLSQLRERLQTL